jgi:hypothetical protein
VNRSIGAFVFSFLSSTVTGAHLAFDWQQRQFCWQATPFACVSASLSMASLQSQQRPSLGVLLLLLQLLSLHCCQGAKCLNSKLTFPLVGRVSLNLTSSKSHPADTCNRELLVVSILNSAVPVDLHVRRVADVCCVVLAGSLDHHQQLQEWLIGWKGESYFPPEPAAPQLAAQPAVQAPQVRLAAAAAAATLVAHPCLTLRRV